VDRRRPLKHEARKSRAWNVRRSNACQKSRQRGRTENKLRLLSRPSAVLFRWLRTPVGALVGGLTTILLTILATWLSPPVTGVLDRQLDRATSGPPLHVQILSVDAGPTGFVSLDDPSRSSISALPTDIVDVRTTTAKVRLTGRLRRGLRIFDAKVRIHARRSPITGTFYHAIGPQAAESVVKLTTDLDGPRPILVEDREKRSAEDSTSYFLDHDITLAYGEHVTFVVTATTERFDVSWDIAFSAVLDDGSEATVIVDHNGRPWRTTAKRPRFSDYRAVYEELDSNPSSPTGSRVWKRRDDPRRYCQQHVEELGKCG
jgi:hypothetical protein